MTEPAERVAEDRALRRIARCLAVACLVLAVLLPPLALVGWSGVDPAARLAEIAGAPVAAPTGAARTAIVAALALLPVLLLSAALVAARRAFARFADGAYFGRDSARALGRFGALIAAGGAVQLVLPTLLGLALSLGGDRGVLVVSLSSQAALGVLLGGILWALGRIMARAADIADDNAGFV